MVYMASFDHPYPTTRIQWAPEGLAREKDLIATSGDYFRLWNASAAADGEVKLEGVLNNVSKREGRGAGGRGRRAVPSGRQQRAPSPPPLLSSPPAPRLVSGLSTLPPLPALPLQNKGSDYCAPLTSFDWNQADQTVVAACSIDTTVTVWDLHTRKVRTQLIAHDREVFDIAWARGKDVFATVGADGSLRMFDLRSLEHSTIMYETVGGVPLLRLAWNKLDNNYVATFSQDTARTVILDIRMPAVPVADLGGHVGCVNAVVWAPHSACHVCTAGDDFQALIWDLSPMPRPVEDPILAYTAAGEVNQLLWSPSIPEWVTIAFDNKVQVLRV